jgi:hypothetical protein
MECQSAGLTDIARTRTRTSSAPGTGFSTSAIRSSSGGPYLSHRNAFMTGLSGFSNDGRLARLARDRPEHLLDDVVLPMIAHFDDVCVGSVSRGQLAR